jgi:HNH endonuclease
MSRSWAATARLVRERAGHRCELCPMHLELQGAEFHIDHIRPKSQGGTDEDDNLALNCPRCNLVKGDRTALTDPDTREQVPFFNPRRDRWSAHFRVNGYQIVGLTAIGRALVAAFDLNSPRRVKIRMAEEAFGYFPPAID